MLFDRFTPARGRVTVLLEQPKRISETRPLGLASVSDGDAGLKSALSRSHSYAALSLEVDDSEALAAVPTISFKQPDSHGDSADEGAAGVLRIHVTDTGAGISKQHQAKLFSPYIQFNAGKLQKGQGSGLGLWISRSKLLMHFVITVHSS